MSGLPNEQQTTNVFSGIKGDELPTADSLFGESTSVSGQGSKYSQDLSSGIRSGVTKACTPPFRPPVRPSVGSLARPLASSPTRPPTASLTRPPIPSLVKPPVGSLVRPPAGPSVRPSVGSPIRPPVGSSIRPPAGLSIRPTGGSSQPQQQQQQQQQRHRQVSHMLPNASMNPPLRPAVAPRPQFLVHQNSHHPPLQPHQLSRPPSTPQEQPQRPNHQIVMQHQDTKESQSDADISSFKNPQQSILRTNPPETKITEEPKYAQPPLDGLIEDTLPSADVLFGGSSTFDLFQPSVLNTQQSIVQEFRPQRTEREISTSEIQIQSYRAQMIDSSATDTSSLFPGPPNELMKADITQNEQTQSRMLASQETKHSAPITQSFPVKTASPRDKRFEPQPNASLSQHGSPLLNDVAKEENLITDDIHQIKSPLLDDKHSGQPKVAANLDPIPVFTESSEMDASQLFSGTTAVDPSAFFTHIFHQNQSIFSEQSKYSYPQIMQDIDLHGALNAIASSAEGLTLESDQFSGASWSDKLMKEQNEGANARNVESVESRNIPATTEKPQENLPLSYRLPDALDADFDAVLQRNSEQDSIHADMHPTLSPETAQHGQSRLDANDTPKMVDEIPQSVDRNQFQDQRNHQRQAQGLSHHVPGAQPSTDVSPHFNSGSERPKAITELSSFTGFLTENQTSNDQSSSDVSSMYPQEPVFIPPATSPLCSSNDLQPSDEPPVSVKDIHRSNQNETKQPDTHQSQVQIASSDSQPISFDDNLAGPSSPTFHRDLTNTFSSQFSHESSIMGPQGSYSILELNAESAHSPYFIYAKQTPLIHEHHDSYGHPVSQSDSLPWRTQQIDVETSTFDQVSLTEDGTTHTPITSPISGPGPKERGLTSLLDHSTLSAVEDLLNMPKSAAFERGMSRLFKGVKSSATSIFSSSLSQLQPKQLPGDDSASKGKVQTSPQADYMVAGPHIDEMSGAATLSASAPDGPNVLPSNLTSDQNQAMAITDDVIATTPTATLSMKEAISSVIKEESSVVQASLSLRDEDRAQIEVIQLASSAGNIAQNIDTLDVTQKAEESYPDASGICLGAVAATSIAYPGIVEPLATSASVSAENQQIIGSQSSKSPQLPALEFSAIPTHFSDIPVEQSPFYRINENSFSGNQAGISSGKSSSHSQLSTSNILNRAVTPQKQAVVSPPLEKTGTLTVRATPDKKQRFLEKGRELLEKRQQKSYPHSPSSKSTTLPSQFSPVIEHKQEVTLAQERSANLSDIFGNLSTMTHRSSFELSTEKDLNCSQQSYQSESSFLPPNEAHQNTAHISNSVPQSHDVVYENGGEPKGTSLVENEKLKQQIASLSAQLNAMTTDRESALILELRSELARKETELDMTNAAFNQLSIRHSEQAEFMAKENRRLQEALLSAQANAAFESQSKLLARCQELESELEQVRHSYLESQAANAKFEQLSRVLEENEQLREELQRSQDQLQEYVLEKQMSSVPLGGVVDSSEQLSKEAEGLRRQLKGQREEMKELQDLIKRSETEKRDLNSKIESLERLLADTEKHRNELKSQQIMKDDAYRVIQQKLIDTFEEEKAQYMDEQAFELAKLEHRYNLVKEELQALQTEVNERQVLTERGVESTAEEEITEQCTLVIAQERVVQLEAELVALRNQNAKHEANANGYGVEVDELRRSEVCLKTELKRSESRLLKLQQELYEMKKHTELLEQSPKVDLHILEGARVHGNSEMRLEDDLVITRKDITMEQSGYDSMAERIIKLQEDCFMAQEEKLRTEGLLNRVQMELVAARDEVERLQASQDEVQNESSFYRNLEQELVQTKSSLKQLQAELKDHDAVVKDLAALRKQHEEMVAAALDQKTTWTTRLSSLTQQLEDQRLEYLHLKQAAEKGQGTPYDVDLESLMSEIQHLKTVLVEERRGSEEQIHALEGQIRQAEDMLQENQKEMERIKIQSKVAESELAALRGYQDEEKWRYDQHMDSISRLQSQLEDTVSKHTTVVDEATLREKRLRVEISALEKSKLELEAQVHSQIVYAEMQKAENHSQMDTIQKLQGDLVMFADKAPEVIHLRNSLTKLQDEHQQASEQTQLIVDLFEKLVPLPGESEKLNALEEIVISTLTNVRLLGYSIQPLTQVALQLIELQRSIVKSRASAPVERETQQIDGPGRDAGLLSNNNEPMNTSDHALEVKELQEKLVKAEHGILKLRQFIHEFQAEEKRTILELQQRLEESENENNHVRSQLAKAQAMLLTKSAELATLTDGSTSASATSLSQSPIQGQTEVQHLKQQPPPQQQGVESEPEYVQGRTLPTDEMFKVFEGTGQVHREAILALEPLRQQKVELERTLLDLRHRYEQSQKENDALLSELEEENQRLKARVMRMSPDTSSNEHQEKIRDLESEVEELMRQLKTAQREREFTRQDMRSLKAELAKRKAQA